MNNPEDYISVIVPLFKGKKYIRGIIDNIKKNAIHIKECKIEIVLINDYPQEKIIIGPEEYVDIKLIENQENKGIHASRIIGLNNSLGDYILFLDQDDKINDFFLKECYTILKGKLNVPFVVCNGIVEHDNYQRLIYKNRIMQRMTQKIIYYALFDNRILSPGQCLIKKNAIPDKWKNSILNNNGADDMLLWILILSNSTKKKPLLIYKNMYTHRNTKNNTSLDTKKMYTSVEEMLSILQKLNINQEILDIIQYRIDLVKKNISTTKINPIFTLVVKSILNYKKRKE